MYSDVGAQVTDDTVYLVHQIHLASELLADTPLAVRFRSSLYACRSSALSTRLYSYCSLPFLRAFSGYCLCSLPCKNSAAVRKDSDSSRYAAFVRITHCSHVRPSVQPVGLITQEPKVIASSHCVVIVRDTTNCHQLETERSKITSARSTKAHAPKWSTSCI